jgi:hypothetical protein
VQPRRSKTPLSCRQLPFAHDESEGPPVRLSGSRCDSGATKARAGPVLTEDEKRKLAEAHRAAQDAQ